jgi:DNA-nicking Smr family endonuclease
MSRDGGKPGRPGTTSRHITPDEAELWSRTTLSVDKVKAKSRVTAHTVERSPEAPPPARPAPPPAKRAAAPPKLRPRPAAPPEPPPAAPAVAPFDRRSYRKVSTGKVAIDATLDLHGLQRDDAHARLRAFLRNSQAQGHRMVLVITGKGGATETGDYLSRTLGHPERGILRRKVPQWLEEAEFSGIVLRYSAASRNHGGSGALYVQLRKARGT